MLETIRNKATGWIAYFILGLVIVPFILWGVGGYADFIGDSAVAKVNGEEISEVAFNLRYERLRQASQAIESKDEKLVKTKLLEELISQMLLDQSVKKLGMRIGEDSVRATLLGLPQFQENGQFSEARFLRLLQDNGFTSASFFNELKKDLLRNQIEKIYQNTDFATAAEIERLFLLLKEKRELAYLLVPSSRFSETIEISEETLNDFYLKNAPAYKSHESASFLYVEIKPEDLTKYISISDSERKTYFEQNMSQFEIPERRELAHILAATPEKINTIRDRLNRGEDFTTLAKEHSEDSATAEKGGTLGVLTRAELPVPFAEAAFALPVGAISKPVKTDFGWHVIKVLTIEAAKTTTLEAVKEEVAKAVLAQKQEALFAEKEEELARLVFEHADSLAPAAKALALTIQKSGIIKRNLKSENHTLFSQDAVLEAAFSEEVLHQDQNSAVIQVAPQHLMVLRKQEYQPARQLSYEEVKEDVREELIEKEARSKAKKLALELVEKLNHGASFQTVAKAYALEPQVFQEITRDDARIPNVILENAFKIGMDALKQYRTVSLPSGETAVLVVQGILPAHVSDLDAEQKKLYASVISNYASQFLYATYLFQLQQDATVKVLYDTENKENKEAS